MAGEGNGDEECCALWKRDIQANIPNCEVPVPSVLTFLHLLCLTTTWMLLLGESAFHEHRKVQEGAESLFLTWWQPNQFHWLLFAAQAWPGSVNIVGKAGGGVIFRGPKSLLEFCGHQGPDDSRRCFWLSACLLLSPAFPVGIGCWEEADPDLQASAGDKGFVLQPGQAAMM